MPVCPIVVLNGGSSSIKFSLYSACDSLALLCEGEASGIGTPKARFALDVIQDGIRREQVSESKPEDLRCFRDAVRKIVTTLDQPEVPHPAAIAHRVVHSGPKLTAHQRVTPQVLEDIEEAVNFAPLHEPIALEIVHETMRHFPGVDNYACFDNIFHQTMPDASSTYPLPLDVRKLGVRRYGFHGLSCESIVQQLRDGRIQGTRTSTVVPPRLLIAHLGSGASVTAVLNGRSIDTTMGLTPCGGVLMGTRPGDLDPGLIFYLLRLQPGNSGDQVNSVEELLNRRSGMLALSDLSSDMRVLRAAASEGNSQATLAIDAFVFSIKKAIGAFTAMMGGLDALVFTGGIGEHDPLTRSQICSGLEVLGIALDPGRNEVTAPTSQLIHAHGSKVEVHVLHTQENRMIAEHVVRMMR